MEATEINGTKEHAPDESPDTADHSTEENAENASSFSRDSEVLFVYTHGEHLRQRFDERLREEQTKLLTERELLPDSWENGVEVHDTHGKTIRPPFDRLSPDAFPLTVVLRRARDADTSSTRDSSNSSSWDRYPAIFSDLATLFSVAEQKSNSFSNESAMHSSLSNVSTNQSHQSNRSRGLKILSVGYTNDGNECETLRRYFPDARIDGLDFDSGLVKKHAVDNDDPLTRYFDDASTLTTEGHESYDAVLAMGSLCSHKMQSETDKWNEVPFTEHLPYENFTSTMKLLDSLVRPGGYLVIYNANYPFSEFVGAPRYKNMARGCGVGRSATVLTLDQKGTMTGQRGGCTPWGKFCAESGWRMKFDRNGEEVQPEGSGMMTFGCMYPGSFFKKIKSLSKDLQDSWNQLEEKDVKFRGVVPHFTGHFGGNSL